MSFGSLPLDEQIKEKSIKLLDIQIDNESNRLNDLLTKIETLSNKIKVLENKVDHT